VAAAIVFVLVDGGALVAWIWFRRHPGRLEVTPSTVTLRHRGRPATTVLPKTGDLYLESHLVGSARVAGLGPEGGGLKGQQLPAFLQAP
jgi:hypothetical protein